ncbi:hypothetical protein TNCV_4829561 [Trichonephila clavipes]|nr:hypothetical protein TNCV_4829561 [Trichonephila clavipes]
MISLMYESWFTLHHKASREQLVTDLPPQYLGQVAHSAVKTTQRSISDASIPEIPEKHSRSSIPSDLSNPVHIFLLFLRSVLIYEAVDLPFCLVPIVIKTLRLHADVIHNAQTHSANGLLICFTLADVCLSTGHLPALSVAHKPHVRERGAARFCYDFS